MPRPGPRPYECIRRAWHRDSHQPLRGTLIHEIFRLVNELHSTSTRRKKEWQEKLPIVVLRAEEILYSKANSEGEYANVETLRSRLDDAVNTMIRREDGEEEGLYLMPCVEAALSLGCVPKKTPQSQRHGSSRHLLNVARRVSPAVKEDCSSWQANHSRSTLGLMTQSMPPQNRDLQSAPHASSNAFFGAVGAFLGPSSCHPPDTTGSNLPQSTSFPEVLEAHQSIGTSLYPKQGALVQFLRETSTSRISGDSLLDMALFCSPPKHFNVQDLRPHELLSTAERSGPRMSSRFPHGYDATCPSDSHQPLPSVPRLPWDVCKDNDNRKTAGLDLNTIVTAPFLRKNAFSSSEWGMNLQVNECSHAPVNCGKAGSNSSLMSTRCGSDRVFSTQSNASASSLCENNDSKMWFLDDHDLQLRLGPPIKKPLPMSEDISACQAYVDMPACAAYVGISTCQVNVDMPACKTYVDVKSIQCN